MVGKNNLKAIKRKSGQQIKRFSLRRLSVGVASVALAGLLFASDLSLVQAAENNDPIIESLEEESAKVTESLPESQETKEGQVASDDEDRAADVDTTKAVNPEEEEVNSEKEILPESQETEEGQVASDDEDQATDVDITEEVNPEDTTDETLSSLDLDNDQAPATDSLEENLAEKAETLNDDKSAVDSSEEAEDIAENKLESDVEASTIDSSEEADSSEETEDHEKSNLELSEKPHVVRPYAAAAEKKTQIKVKIIKEGLNGQPFAWDHYLNNNNVGISLEYKDEEGKVQKEFQPINGKTDEVIFKKVFTYEEGKEKEAYDRYFRKTWVNPDTGNEIISYYGPSFGYDLVSKQNSGFSWKGDGFSNFTKEYTEEIIVLVQNNHAFGEVHIKDTNGKDYSHLADQLGPKVGSIVLVDDDNDEILDDGFLSPRHQKELGNNQTNYHFEIRGRKNGFLVDNYIASGDYKGSVYKPQEFKTQTDAVTPTRFNFIMKDIRLTEDPKDSDYVKVSFNATDKGEIVGMANQYVIKGIELINGTIDVPEVKPIDGWKFIGWDVEPAANKKTFQYDKDVTYTAKFSQDDNLKYDPVTPTIKKDYGVRPNEKEITGSVSFKPDYEEGKKLPVVSIDDDSQIPDGQTAGDYTIDLTVTYPDQTTDKATTTVTIAKQHLNDKYQTTTQPIEKDYGVVPSEKELTEAVTFTPEYDEEGDALPVVTIDDQDQIPDGQTAGDYSIDLTVTYPDGTKVQDSVTVTIAKQPLNDKYQPATQPIEKDYGVKPSKDEITESVSFKPDYEEAGNETPVVTINDASQIPDGKTAGDYTIDLTVTYPDGTTDTDSVTVTIAKQPLNDKYQTATQPIEKDYGVIPSEKELTEAVTFTPAYNEEGAELPVVSIDDASQIPDGKTAGDYTIDLTVTYPDGTSDTDSVTVTIAKQPLNDKYQTVTQPIEKDYGVVPSEKELTEAVTFTPEYTEEGDELPVVSIDDASQIPDGKVAGDYSIDLTVTYPDGTQDHDSVTVTIAKQPLNDKYQTVTQPIEKDYGVIPSEKELTEAVRFTAEYDEEGDELPVVSIDDASQIPDGKTAGDYTIDLTVTYPDGTKDYDSVKVTIAKQPLNDKYQPVTQPIEKDYGVIPSEKEITEAVTFTPEYVEEGDELPVVAIDDPSQIPDGKVAGDYTIDLTVTYPDGTQDQAVLIVTINEKPLTWAERIDPVIPDKVGVKDSNNLTNIEKEKVKIAVADANDYPITNDFPKGTDILVGFKGDIIINYPDDSHDVIAAEDLVYQLTVSDQTGADSQSPSSTDEFHADESEAGESDGQGSADQEAGKDNTKETDQKAGKDSIKETDQEAGNDNTKETDQEAGKDSTKEIDQETGKDSTKETDQEAGKTPVATEAKDGKSATSSAKSSDSDLPETGEADNNLAFGAAALSVLAGLGMVAPRRKEEE